MPARNNPLSRAKGDSLVLVREGKGQCLRAPDVAKRKNIEHNAVRSKGRKGVSESTAHSKPWVTLCHG